MVFKYFVNSSQMCNAKCMNTRANTSTNAVPLLWMYCLPHDSVLLVTLLFHVGEMEFYMLREWRRKKKKVTSMMKQQSETKSKHTETPVQKKKCHVNRMAYTSATHTHGKQIVLKTRTHSNEPQ